MFEANCIRRCNSVTPPVSRGTVWMRPACGVALHGAGEADQRRAGHDAVAVENDEVVVGAAEALDPVLQMLPDLRAVFSMRRR